jgi:hypothetical protein
MATHRFRVGQEVQFTRGFPFRTAPAGTYKIVRQLPDSAGELLYRIKSSKEPHERVVKESDLENL